MEEHLSECDACQAEWDSLQGLSVRLHEVPAPEFVSHERFVAQVNLRLPERRQVKSTGNNGLSAGWWMIPIGLLAAWIFFSTAMLISDMVSVADNFGLLDNTTASFVSNPSDSAGWTLTLEQVGVLKGNSLRWAETTESFTRNAIPQFIWQVSIALVYLAWIVIWWARQNRQVNEQLIEG